MKINELIEKIDALNVAMAELFNKQELAELHALLSERQILILSLIEIAKKNDPLLVYNYLGKLNTFDKYLINELIESRDNIKEAILKTNKIQSYVKAYS